MIWTEEYGGATTTLCALVVVVAVCCIASALLGAVSFRQFAADDDDDLSALADAVAGEVRGLTLDGAYAHIRKTRPWMQARSPGFIKGGAVLNTREGYAPAVWAIRFAPRPRPAFITPGPRRQRTEPVAAFVICHKEKHCQERFLE